MLTPNMLAQEVIDYEYASVPIGGGGYITGMKIHPTNSDVRYYRTDIGGAYRWNAATQRLEQIIYATEPQRDYFGVAGIALDPNNENRVILAVGRKCDLFQSAILESYDRGQSWTVYESPVYFASNGGRECSDGTDKDRQGSPIVLNPANPDELFIGSRDEGLWRLNFSNDLFTRIAQNIIPSNTTRKSIRSVLFHPVDTTKVFISYIDHGIYRGDLSTGIYEKVSGNILQLNETSDLSFSATGSYLFAACKKSGIYRCDNPLDITPSWSMVLPYAGTDPTGEGFLTVTAHPTLDEVVATVYGDWSQIDNFRISQNFGALNSWVEHDGNLQTNIYPHRTLGHGSHISQIAFDPNAPDHLYFTSWFTTTQTTNWDVPTIQWSNAESRGHEEVVITDVSAFTTNAVGNYLVHLGGDQTGFMEDDVASSTYPNETMRDLLNNSVDLVKGASVSVCHQQPDHLVACFTKNWDNSAGDLAISSDGGATFTRSTGYDDALGKSIVAVSSMSPNRVVIATTEGLKWSADGGNTFNSSVSVSSMTDACFVVPSITGIGAGNVNTNSINTSVFSVVRCLAADKELGCTFYFYDWLDGSFHVSTDYGEHFMKVSDGLPTFVNGTLNKWRYKTRIQTVPGKPQHIWINFDTGLYYSEDGGVNWTIIPNVQNARLVGIGKQMTGSNYPTLFLYGKANNNNYFKYYRSTDKGLTWLGINNITENESFGSPRILEGDLQVEGQYYIGTSGLGLIYGKESAISMTVDTVFEPNCCKIDSAAYECSGLVVNRYDSYWMHNDADNDSTIFELDENCDVVREVALQGIENLDFEDMTKDDDGNFYVGEFGSKNKQYSSNGLYDSLYIYKIGNPDFHCESSVVPEVISFTYPSTHSYVGDTEAMFYDDGKLYLIPKLYSTNPNAAHAGKALLFSIPAIPNPGSQYTATYITSVDISEYPELPIDRHKVTAASLSPDKKTLVMLGYYRFWVMTDFTRGTFLDGNLTPISFPNNRQREAVDFADNHTIYITDENKSYNPNRGHLVKVDLCDFVPTIENCSCKTKFTSQKLFNFQNAVEEYENGYVNNGSSDLELTYDFSATGNQKIGLRYFDLDIPKGAHISQAYIQFTVDETDNINPSALTFRIEEVDQSAVFVSDSFNLSNRIFSSQNIPWSPPSWNGIGSAQLDQRSPDLSTLVQQIVNRDRWSPDNAMTFMIEGIGNRTAESHYHCGNSAPTLIIEYCTSTSLPCVQNLLLGNEELKNLIYSSSQLIQSAGEVMLPRQTTFSAGNEIDLDPGFEVQLGSEFIGEIDGCN